MGVPRHEILPVSRLIATKLVANEFVAYLALTGNQATAPLSPRAFTIASYALCGFANIASVGIQIGVLSALAPSKSKQIVRLAPSAMICGFVSSLQCCTTQQIGTDDTAPHKAVNHAGSRYRRNARVG